MQETLTEFLLGTLKKVYDSRPCHRNNKMFLNEGVYWIHLIPLRGCWESEL